MLYRDNVTSTASRAQDELYGYDGLNCLIDFRRGTLDATHTSVTGTPSATETWSLDALGNWLSETAHRTHNAENQITTTDQGYSPTGCGSGGTPSYALSYDSAGNMLSDDLGNPYAYDAWNRLVRVATAAGPASAFTYTADGRAAATAVNCGPAADTDSYYDLAWRVVETDLPAGTTSPSSTRTPQVQYVWGLTYVNDLVERDDAGVAGDLGTAGSGLGRRLYAVRDANHDVVAVTGGSTGAVAERFSYDLYGTRATLDAATYAGAADLYGTAGSDDTHWNVGFQGGVELQPPYGGTGTTLIQFDNRVYDAGLGRWVQQDPAGYVDGGNTYAVEKSDPTNGVDPSGLYVKEFKSGTLKWSLESDGNDGVKFRASFQPASGKACPCKNISFIQTVVTLGSKGPVQPAAPKNDPNFFKRLALKGGHRVDLLPTEEDPYYGAKWDSEQNKWVDERAGTDEVGSGPAGKAAKMGDGPHGLNNVTQIFATYVVCIDTGEILGGVTWGYSKFGDDPVSILQGTEEYANSTPPDPWKEALQKYKDVYKGNKNVHY